MSKRLPELYAFDILIAAAKIREVVGRFDDAQNLRHDFMAWDSVIREFEIIGEAMRGLIDSGYASQSERAIVDFRNVLIHEYFGIDEEEVWGVVTTHLSPLRERIRELVHGMEKSLREELIAELCDENRHLPFVVDELKSLKPE